MRPDLQVVAELVRPGSRVLDLGCGTGELLDHLAHQRSCTVTGVDTDPESLISAIRRGVAVIDLDIDTQLDQFGDDTYDLVIVSQTLQATRHPAELLGEVIRIAPKAVVSVPNFALWKHRLHLLAKGRMPVSPELPYTWFDTPNIHLATLADVEKLFDDLHIQVDRRLVIDASGRVVRGLPARRLANLLAAGAVYLLSR